MSEVDRPEESVVHVGESKRVTLRRSAPTLLLVAALSAAIGLPATLGCSSSEDDTASDDETSGKAWAQDRAQREKAIREHYEKNAEGAEALLTGASGQGQVPMVMFRLFNDLFPDIWGDADAGYAPVGLPANTLRPNTKLPLGMGMAPALKPTVGGSGASRALNLVGFNCVSCHAGQVVDSAGKVRTMVGAPNTRVNTPLFLMARTSAHPNFTADNFRNALLKKPAGWVYGDPALLEVEKAERDLFLEPGVAETLVTDIKTRGAALLGGFNGALKPFLYGQANAPDPFAQKRGTHDALIPTYLAYLTTLPQPINPADLAAALPTSAAEIDMPSIWNQRGRGVSHWDGALPVVLFRNVGAASASLNKPVNIDNVAKVTAFLEDLPADPYPFNVDMRRARRGKVLFDKNCASCHGSTNRIFAVNDVGTDPNRFAHMTSKGATFLGGLLKALCSDPTHCKKPDGTDYAPSELVVPTTGYEAGRLDGIWARAPYLHNGSVPTLRALLTNDRPAKFNRGALTYDQRNVGFSWSESSPSTVVYDTSVAGNSNAGHNTPAYLGIDWKARPADLDDLLEYLKTL